MVQVFPHYPLLIDCARSLRALRLRRSQRRMHTGHVLTHESCVGSNLTCCLRTVGSQIFSTKTALSGGCILYPHIVQDLRSSPVPKNSASCHG